MSRYEWPSIKEAQGFETMAGGDKEAGEGDQAGRLRTGEWNPLQSASGVLCNLPCHGAALAFVMACPLTVLVSSIPGKTYPTKPAQWGPSLGSTSVTARLPGPYFVNS
jgi:hypothetical protein